MKIMAAWIIFSYFVSFSVAWRSIYDGADVIFGFISSAILGFFIFIVANVLLFSLVALGIYIIHGDETWMTSCSRQHI